VNSDAVMWVEFMWTALTFSITQTAAASSERKKELNNGGVNQ